MTARVERVVGATFIPERYIQITIRPEVQIARIVIVRLVVLRNQPQLGTGIA